MPIAWTACTFVKAQLMLNDACRFWSILSSKLGFAHKKLYGSKIEELRWSLESRPDCSPDLSHWVHSETDNTVQKTSEQMESCIGLQTMSVKSPITSEHLILKSPQFPNVYSCTVDSNNKQELHCGKHAISQLFSDMASNLK